MARKYRMIFTDNKQSKRGIMSVVFGVLCLISMIYAITTSYKLEGNIGINYGAALLVTLVISVIGIILGVNARMDVRKFPLLPTIGIIINACIVIVLGFILWIGLK